MYQLKCKSCISWTLQWKHMTQAATALTDTAKGLENTSDGCIVLIWTLLNTVHLHGV